MPRSGASPAMLDTCPSPESSAQCTAINRLAAPVASHTTRKRVPFVARTTRV